MPETVPTKQYDWTYTTTYAGHPEPIPPDPDAETDGTASVSSTGTDVISWRSANPDDRSECIPIAELSRQDPILFYAEIPLFEDELHDNGASHVLVRVVSDLNML